MPAGSTPAPHYRQSSPGACLPACVRMVLASYGDKYTEAQIAAALGSYEFGTPASRVMQLVDLGYRVRYGPSTLKELEAHLNYHALPIVFVRADLLPWADFAGFHALVLVQITATDVALLDPALEDGPTLLSKEAFLLAWEEFERLSAVILKPAK